MDILSLDVQSRNKSLKAKDLLRSNLIPMEYYGRGVGNKSLQVDYQTFRKLFRVSGTNTVIELNVDGKEKFNVLVHEIQQNPITDTITHVDFINVRMDQELHTRIPLKFVGDAPAVRELAGILTHHLTEVEVKCLPKYLVHDIEVSIAPLVDFNSYVRVKDLVVPDGITILNGPEDIVANVVPPRLEEEPVAAPAEGEAVAEEGAAVEGAEGDAKAEAEPDAEEKEKKKK